MAQVTPPSRHAPKPAKMGERTIKRTLNTPLLIGTIVLLAVGGGIVIAVHQYFAGQIAGTFLQRAAMLEKEEDWVTASAYLGRYLQLEPADLDARMRLLTAVEKSATTAQGNNRLISLLYQMVGSLPERTDLRTKLVEKLLARNQFKAAEEAARELAESSDAAQQQVARRAAAFLKLSLALENRGTSLNEAVDAMQDALELDPGDIVLATRTAYLLRGKADELGAEASPDKADSVMDRLVAAKPEDAEALLTRSEYRRRYQLEGAESDLAAAIKIAPENIAALLMSADANLQSGDKDRQTRAKSQLESAIKLAPLDPRGYLGLARYYAAIGEKGQSIKTLQDAEARLTEQNLDVLYLLAQLQLEARELKDALATAKEFGALVDKLSQAVGTSTRIQLENMRRALDAKLAFAGGDFAKAARESKAIIVAGEKAGDVVESVELLNAYAMLATMMSQANRMELAATYWAALSSRAPGHADAALKAAATYAALGKIEEALSHAERYLKLPNASPEATLVLMQLRLQEQLKRPVPMRDWVAFKAATKAAEEKLPNRWELSAVKVVYLLALDSPESREAASKELQEWEKQHPADQAAVERLAIIYRQLGRNADATRVVSEFRKTPGNDLHGAILQSGLLTGDKQYDAALKLLDETLVKLPEDGRREVELMRIRVLLAAGKAEQAQQATAALIGEQSKDAQLLALGIEIALVRQDFDSAQKWEKLLQTAPQVDDFDWQYLQARRLIGQYAKLDTKQRGELDRLVASLQAERPGWVPIFVLSGSLAEMRGDKEAAIEAYRSAVAAGDRRPEILQRLAKALYSAGRFDEAKQLLSEFKTSDAAKGQLESMAIVAAAQGNRLAEARELAQQAVDGDSKDPLHYIWLANLDYQAGKQAAAEQTFRKALERFPRDERIWRGVFLFFVESKQPDKARLALTRWVERAQLSDGQKELVLGDGEQLLGDRAAAEAHFRKCISLDERDLAAHLRLAKLLMESDPKAARAELDAVRQIDPNNVEARQYLAAVLAASGSEADWVQAVQLLERTATTDNSSAADANDRLHAILLARKGENQQKRLENCQEAAAILSKRLQQPDALSPDFDMDRMLLAGIYEQEARLEKKLSPIAKARDVLRPLIERPEVTQEHLLSYIQLLMRNLSPGAATNFETDAEAAGLKEAFAAEATNRIEELEQLLAKSAQADAKTLPTALRVTLLTLKGQSQDGRELIEGYAERELAGELNDSDRAKVYLRVGGLYQAAEFNDEAERWFRKLVEITPSGYVLVAQSLLKQGKPEEAIDFCISAGEKMPPVAVATVLAQILSSEKSDQELDRKAQPLIDAALDADRGNVDLLMSVAVQKVTRNDIDGAAKLFKRVIELQPTHTIALNNLATLYAEQPDHLNDAQMYVERAMAVAGRNPALLDTLGTILLRAGKYDEAVAALEESVAGSASDPRYYFHLAAAYEGAKQPDKARDALNTAVEMGLETAILTEGDRKLLDSLKQQLLAMNDQN